MNEPIPDRIMTKLVCAMKIFLNLEKLLVPRPLKLAKSTKNPLKHTLFSKNPVQSVSKGPPCSYLANFFYISCIMINNRRFFSSSSRFGYGGGCYVLKSPAYKRHLLTCKNFVWLFVYQVVLYDRNLQIYVSYNWILF